MAVSFPCSRRATGAACCGDGSPGSCGQRDGRGRGRVFSLQNKLLNSSIVWNGGGLVASNQVQNFCLERDAGAVGAPVVAGGIAGAGAALGSLRTGWTRRLTAEPSSLLGQVVMDQRRSLGSSGRARCLAWVKSTDLSVLLWDPCSGLTDWVTSSPCLFLVLITWSWSGSFLPPACFVPVSVYSCCSTVCTGVVAACGRSHCQQVRRRDPILPGRKGLQSRNIKLLFLSFIFFVKTKNTLCFNLGFIWVKHEMSSPHHPSTFVHPVRNTCVYG